MVRGVEGVGTCLFGTSGGETWGIDAGDHDERCTVFPPWTVTRDVWHAALSPDGSGVAVDALLFHEAGRRLVHRYRVYKDPFPHLAHSSEDIDPVVRGSSGSGACGVFSGGGGTPPVPQPRRRRVSFVDEVTMLGVEDSPEYAQLVPPLILEEAVVVTETEVPSLILPVVEELNNGTPEAEQVVMEPSAMESGFDGRTGSGCVVLPLGGQFIGSDTGGGLRSLAPAVGGQ